MCRGQLLEAERGPALELVAPGIDDRPDAIHAERDRHVARDGIGVHQQHGLPARREHGGEVGGEHGLAHAPLGVEHGNQLSALRPGAGLELALEHGPLPSSTATERMHMASMRQRIDLAQ